MCGIAGIIAPEPPQTMPETLKAFAESLRHRGPDDVGYLGWSGRGAAEIGRHPELAAGARVGFAHRRLSIIDLTEGGWQPMSTPDGRYHVVCNGEIYNYLELRDELRDLGFTFRSQSDTEVLLAAYAAWGLAAFERLVGMFALAILDTHDRTLLLVRDPFGIKPLYLLQWQGGLAFASEIKALAVLPGISRQAHPQSVYEYLRFGVTDRSPRTMFEAVKQLPAACYLNIPLDGPYDAQPVRYWNIDVAGRADISLDEAARGLREIFLDNIQLHLRSDVPVGAALSGGIDSSAIVCGMREVGGKDLTIHTFSHVAEGELNEEKWADMAAGAAGAEMHKVHPQAEELVADLDELLAAQDEPFGSTSIYAQLRVFRLAREHGIKVMLDGQGADELLAGYQPHVAARALSLRKAGQPARARRLLRNGGKLPGASRLQLAMRARGLGCSSRPGRALRKMFGRRLIPAWLDGRWLEQRGVAPREMWSAGDGDVLRQHLLESVTDKALPMLLRYEDRNSMAHSVESRVPFLTPKLASFVLSLPEEFLLADDATSKVVFRKAMAGIVPDEILARRDKIGFATPERQWFAALRPWMQRVLDSPAAATVPLKLPAAKRLLEKTCGARGRPDPAIWRCVNLIRWAECHNVSFEV